MVRTIQRRRFSAADSAPPIQRRPIQRRRFSAGRFSAVRFSAGRFSTSQFSAGRFSASLNDFDLKKFRPFFTENYVFFRVQLVKLGTR
ncbi:Hypothetical protein FKW44_017225 [Caligus rogercresseyi]|uniref:Uncharacterized protein n=1 Tax=Caligus rogercresseyi TaxID=217165 RepID=A0A7T8H314_CALRO|nr:Hypothetical protein FKW44_017225 [Caligus rogercresseyi]